MGADIHIFAERKIDGKWHMCQDYRSINGGALEAHTKREAGSAKPHIYWVTPKIALRNYAFFADLAGVRGDGPEPLGLPDDVSEYVARKAQVWDADGHSFSWISIEDVLPLILKHKLSDEEITELVDDRLKWGPEHKRYFLSKFLALHDLDDDTSVDDYRLVFWFDN